MNEPSWWDLEGRWYARIVWRVALIQMIFLQVSMIIDAIPYVLAYITSICLCFTYACDLTVQIQPIRERWLDEHGFM